MPTAAAPRTFFDVSRPIFGGMAVYPRNPEVTVSPARSIARGDSSNVSALALGSHTGTHQRILQAWRISEIIAGAGFEAQPLLE